MKKLHLSQSVSTAIMGTGYLNSNTVPNLEFDSAKPFIFFHPSEVDEMRKLLGLASDCFADKKGHYKGIVVPQ